MVASGITEQSITDLSASFVFMSVPSIKFEFYLNMISDKKPTPGTLIQPYASKDFKVPALSSAIRRNITSKHSSTSSTGTRKGFAAFKRCLTAMPQIEPTLTERTGLRVRHVQGLDDLETLRWGSETLLLGAQTLDCLQDAIAAGNAGLLRGIYTLGVFMPAQASRIREFITLLDGWLVWSGSEADLKAKLDLAALGYALMAPALEPSRPVYHHRLDLLDGLSDAHLSLLPLLVEGLTDEELAASRKATLPTTKLLVRQLLARLQCRNRTEAAIFAWRYADVLASYRAPAPISAPQPGVYPSSDFQSAEMAGETDLGVQMDYVPGPGVSSIPVPRLS